MDVQIPLIKAEPLAPLPVKSDGYVPVVQNRSGELDALRHAADDTWSRMTPLIQFASRGQLAKPAKISTVRGWVKRAANAVHSHPVYLDVMEVSRTHPVATKDGDTSLLEVVYAEARKRAVQFVPVARIGIDDGHWEVVADAAARDGHGAALRYPIRDVALPEGTGQKEHFEGLLAKLALGPEDADLLVDLAYIDPDVDFDLVAPVRELEVIGRWRSIVVIGTSIPSMMGCIAEGTVGSLPRREWEVWRELTDAGLQRIPAFGDYAVQHPLPPKDGGGPGMRANIRYTANGETLIARGHGPVIQEGKEQYRELCQQLVGRKEFAGSDYTWGDSVINDCADGEREPGSQSLWRGAGTSHHLRVVTDQLQQRQADLQTAGSRSGQLPGRD